MAGVASHKIAAEMTQLPCALAATPARQLQLVFCAGRAACQFASS